MCTICFQLRDLQAEPGAGPLHDPPHHQCQVSLWGEEERRALSISFPSPSPPPPPSPPPSLPSPSPSPLSLPPPLPPSLSACNVCEINSQHQLLTVGTQEVGKGVTFTTAAPKPLPFLPLSLFPSLPPYLLPFSPPSLPPSFPPSLPPFLPPFLPPSFPPSGSSRVLGPSFSHTCWGDDSASPGHAPPPPVSGGPHRYHNTGVCFQPHTQHMQATVFGVVCVYIGLVYAMASLFLIA